MRKTVFTWANIFRLYGVESIEEMKLVILDKNVSLTNKLPMTSKIFKPYVEILCFIYLQH